MPLAKARKHFYAGDFARADQALATLPDPDKDKILWLMERGTIRQAQGRYAASAADWRTATDLDRRLEAYSLTEGAASLVVNDMAQSFRGEPFERVLLYAFLAKSYLAEANWDYAAIAARNIIDKLENRDGFPDDPYSRYVAGLCLELIADRGNAAIQYRAASELLTTLSIDQDTGWFSRRAPTNETALAAPPPVARPPRGPDRAELVCLVMIGRSPTGRQAAHGYLPNRTPPYAEFYCRGRYLGRSWPLTTVTELINETAAKKAGVRAAKTVARVVIKDSVADAVADDHPILGALLYVVLMAAESPDTRRWETLPDCLQVARVDCPADLDGYQVVFRGLDGPAAQRTVTAPIVRRGRVFVSFCRDLAPRSLPEEVPEKNH